MRNLKKILSAFLAVLMVVFSVPFTASAATSSETPHVHLNVYDYKYDADLPGMCWGPQSEVSAHQYGMDETLTAGTAYAVGFFITGMSSYKSFQIDGSYDINKITPSTVTVKRGNMTVNNDQFGGAATPNPSFLADITGKGGVVLGTTAPNSAPANYMSDDTVLGYYRIVFQTISTQGTDVSGKTYVTDGWDGTDYNGCYIDGTLLQMVCITVKQEMTVAELYNAFDFSIANDQKGRDKNGDDFTAVTFGPLGGSDPAPTKDTYTYTFADGVTTQTVEVEAGQTPTAPVNTAATDFVKDAGADTHSRTAYKWVADGDKAFKEVSYKDTAACNFKETSAKVDPIHTATELKDGKEAVQTCEVCHATKGGEVIKAEHKWTITPVAATCTVQAHNHYVCACGAEKDADFTGELADHTWKLVSSTAGDCLTAGTSTYKCEVCGKEDVRTGDVGAHKLTAHEAVEAKCETAGNDAYWTCDTCGKIFADADATTELDAIPVIDALGHSFTNYVNNEDATCQTNATETAKCDRCDKTDTREIENSTVAHQFTVAGATTPGTCTTKAETVMSCAFGCGATEIAYGDINPDNHVSTHVDEKSAVTPTRATAGKEADTVCDACGNVVKEGAVIPALGVNITVSGSSLGTAAINGKDIADATENVPYESAYTLVATPADNAEFIGWMVGNKIVSKEATYTTNAYADMTYAPAFAAKDNASFTVTFVDSYGNVTATIDSAELATLTALPEAPSFAGLTFLGWDLDLDGVKALTKATTVTAKYENDTAKMYTVSAPNATILVDGKDCGSETQVTYNTLVTVKAEGATAWKVNGSETPAAYGAEYAFYCGSNITVDMVNDDTVTAKPEVKAVSKDANGYKVTFLATRSVPTGYQLVESGFVYGKAMAATDLVLENVGKTAGAAGATVKQIVCNNKGADGQFALAYGVKNMDANACAAAYVIYKDGAKSVVIYSDAMIYEY